MSRHVIAVCGKGGVGKTSISAMIARHIRKATTLRTLLVDADHAGGLSLALGITPRRTLNDLRCSIISRIQSGNNDAEDLQLDVDHDLMDILEESGSFAFLSIGRPEEDGCYCSVHTLLKEAIQSLADSFDVTLIDAEAGIEQLNRKVLDAVTEVLLVSDGSIKSIRVAETLAEIAAKKLPLARPGLLLNRLQPTQSIQSFARQTSLPLVGSIPEDDTIRNFDAKALPFFDLPDCPATMALSDALSNFSLDF